MKTPFFQASDVCNFSNCISVTFPIMNDIASVGDDVIIVSFKSKGNISLAHQDRKPIHARRITSGKRANIGAKLLKNSVSNIFHQQFRNDKNVEGFSCLAFN